MNINQIIQEELTKMLNEEEKLSDEAIARNLRNKERYKKAQLAGDTTVKWEYPGGGGPDKKVLPSRSAPTEIAATSEAKPSAAWQEKRSRFVTKGPKGLAYSHVTMSRGDPAADPHATETTAPVEVGETYKKERTGDTTAITDIVDFATPEAAKRLSGQDFQGTIRKRDAEGETKGARFIQPVRQYGRKQGFAENRNVSESKLNQIIQEELTKMLNEEIQKEELPVIYRIQGFIDFLNSKDAKLVGPDEVMWRQDPRYPATKTALRAAWQAYKKEKFNL